MKLWEGRVRSNADRGWKVAAYPRWFHFMLHSVTTCAAVRDSQIADEKQMENPSDFYRFMFARGCDVSSNTCSENAWEDKDVEFTHENYRHHP